MNDNILDENLSGIEKPYVRTLWIQQIETVLLIISAFFIGLTIWNLITYNLTALIFSVIGQIIVFIAIFWWRQESIRYDNNHQINKIQLPSLLSGLRVFIPIYAVWAMFANVLSIRYLHAYYSSLTALEFWDLAFVFLRMFVSFALAIGYFYYWRITKQSMDFVNK